MRVIEIVKNGNPDVLKHRDVPIPEAKADEILIKVFAAGINFADVLARQGIYPDAPKKPFVPGYEVAGTIEKVGKEVQGLKIGQRVAGLTDFGGYAEYAVCKNYLTMPLDSHISYEEGAAIPVNWLTAYHSIYHTGPIMPGYKALVHAGAGGVGLASIQLLNNDGYEIIATAGSDEKIDYLKKLDVALAINYRSEEFSEKIVQAYGKKSIDLIIDSTGLDLLQKDIRLLRKNGRLIILGIASFTGISKLRLMLKVLRQFKFSPLNLLGNGHGVYGINILDLVRNRRELTEIAFRDIMEMFSRKKVHTVIDSVFPLEKASEAHTRLESRKSIGKVILTNEHR